MAKAQVNPFFKTDIDSDSIGESEESIGPKQTFTTFEKSMSFTGSSGTSSINLISKPREKDQEKSFEDFTPGSGKELFEIPATQIKEINRAVTRRLSQESIDAFLEERETLVKKKLAGDISKREETRLTFVRWQLDRVDDAIFGPRLDTLERMTEVYEGFASNIKTVLSQIKPEVEKKKKSHKR